MKVTILTPVSQLFEGEAKSVKAPGIDGGLEILDRHAPIISALGKGTISITDTKGQKHKFDIKKGFLEVIQNEVSVLVRV
jgi:F-type H+-transporting ATPase subunit epsilon